MPVTTIEKGTLYISCFRTSRETRKGLYIRNLQIR